MLVKHASPLGAPDLAEVARETVYRGLADALIVTGPSTGSPADPGDLATVKDAVPVVPVLVGSGLDEHNADAFLPLVDGAIVGTSLKVDGETRNPVDRERVERLARRFRAYR